MKNLLHIVHYPVFGGPHNQALRLAEPLRERGWNTVVLLPDEPGNAAERLAEAGVEVVSAPLGRLRAIPSPVHQARYASMLPRDVAAIRKVIRERDIALVVLAGHVNVQGAIAARLEHVPVIWQVLDTRTPAAMDAVLLRTSRKLADVVMTTGRLLADRHASRLGARQRVIPFYPPVSCAEFRPNGPNRAAVRAEWSVSDDDLVLGSVANINPQKGIDQLIEAFAHARHRAPDARIKLVLVGAEYDTHRAYSEDLRISLARHGLIEGLDVVFTGGRSDIARQLQGFDTFVMGSVPNSEGVPTVILEAMAGGLPVVATNVGAVAEVVDEGITGFVVPPLQPEALAEAALRILRDPGLRVRMSNAAREQAVARFDVEICAQTHIDAFEAAIEQHGRQIRRLEMNRAA